MNVQTITMDPEVAKSKLEAYRSRRHADADELYRRCEEAFATLAEGTPILDVQQVFEQCPVDEEGRPRLAIARADRKEIEFRGYRSTFCFDSRADRYSFLHRDNTSLYMSFNGSRFADAKDGYALLPMVPADVRPQKGQLRDWFILWEVDQWYSRPTIEPPRDPYLLQHLGGTLYAILAEWELTDLEMAIMREVLS